MLVFPQFKSFPPTYRKLNVNTQLLRCGIRILNTLCFSLYAFMRIVNGWTVILNKFKHMDGMFLYCHVLANTTAV